MLRPLTMSFKILVILFVFYGVSHGNSNSPDLSEVTSSASQDFATKFSSKNEISRAMNSENDDENGTEVNFSTPTTPILPNGKYRSVEIYVISEITGWLYFILWSITFYPLSLNNYRRKSVIGLNFDFLLLNVVGFMMYLIFNLGIYLIPEVKEEYLRRHPGALNPVQPNDIFFSVNAVLSTMFTIYQCCIYERGNQKVSTTGKSLTTIYCFLSVGLILLANLNVIMWLDVLYVCSYIKLWITFTKYIPQIYMNYNRKSTGGFSIGTVFLDFFGGILSISQMILDAYNYDDWTMVIGNPTKFGLGFISSSFNSIFLMQHYLLYDQYHAIKGRTYC